MPERIAMEKLTSILAVAESASSGIVVLDKAARLARVFGARVELLVTEPGLLPEFTSLCAEPAYAGVTIGSSTRQPRESLPGLLLRRIAERQPDLVVKAPAGVHPLRAWTIDTSDRELVARCPVPVLLVRMKAWRAPIRMAAAVDVSDPEAAMVARGVLQSAGFLALGLQGNLDILYTEREARDETLRMERAVKLSKLVREYYVGCERLQMFDGPPDTRLPAIVGPRQYDILALGGITHRTVTPLRETLTSKLFEAIDGDVLLVKPGMRECARTRSAAASPRQEIPHHAEELV
jgi:hypothetical protein